MDILVVCVDVASLLRDTNRINKNYLKTIKPQEENVYYSLFVDGPWGTLSSVYVVDLFILCLKSWGAECLHLFYILFCFFSRKGDLSTMYFTCMKFYARVVLSSQVWLCENTILQLN